jgi:two-component system, OmpR family, sensor histidine kinase KdpD
VGNIRLFLGGSGGVTALRAMLETAATAQQNGADIVVGLAHSCGDDAIDRLLRSFERVPASTRIEVDAVRKRAPSILLIDTRPPPSGESARAPRDEHPYEPWEDIENIVGSGIGVWVAVDATGFSSWTSLGIGVPPQVNGLSLL